jgi:hypothetical protein
MPNHRFAVLNMYTKSGAKASKHEWTADADKLGTLSYVSTQLCVIGGTHFSSVVCPKLDCATFLHLPATHILFSLWPFYILTQPLPLTMTALITALGPGRIPCSGPYSCLTHAISTTPGFRMRVIFTASSHMST